MLTCGRALGLGRGGGTLKQGNRGLVQVPVAPFKSYNDQDSKIESPLCFSLDKEQTEALGLLELMILAAGFMYDSMMFQNEVFSGSKVTHSFFGEVIKHHPSEYSQLGCIAGLV
ncbi:hypothetical protein JOB18_000393 [Solea senegalensis]|uniref:Uncharacterized protein n=1 Tax=Solea senegalensis TaxID=28829 RepID=A0AAV6S5Y4_SOLSE|nr:hypothetical protein JOB18_000393 [Solea senegalensis]